MQSIYVTKTFLPPLEEYEAYVQQIWNSGQLTNQGPLLKKFEVTLEARTGLSNFHFVSNGTIALQLALRALDITEGEVITTPFSYVATTSAILWERCQPVFVDIDPATFCIDASKIEAAITKNTKAILAVHVFGIPCDVPAIEAIARKHHLKVIYDGAHAFNVKYLGQQLLAHGDVSMCSFHATKLFHTVEGGGIFTKHKALSEKIELMKRFGHNFDDHFMLGINAKVSEFHAAMGLCNLNYIDEIIRKRQAVVRQYDQLLGNGLEESITSRGVEWNYSYYPVVLANERQLQKALEILAAEHIFPRRYFFPSLNRLPYLQETQACPISESIAPRIMCLPLYDSLSEADVQRICKLLKKADGF